MCIRDRSENIFVLGNGPSRANIDTSKLDGTVIGCNACYRDFTPDVICAIDAGVISDIVESGFNGDCYFTHNCFRKFTLITSQSYKYNSDNNKSCTENDSGCDFLHIA